MLSSSGRWLLAGAIGGLLSTLVSGQAPPLYQAPFFSRPDLNPPSFTWAIFDSAAVTPGYILLTPYTAPPDSALAAAPQSVAPALLSLLSSQTGGCTLAILEEILSIELQNGPYIYDTKGQLVYSGYGGTGGQLAHDLKVAEYEGQRVLTYFQGNDRQGGNRGHGVIMNDRYQTIASVSPGLGRTSSDVHEFTVLPGGTALTTIFQPRPYDLTSFGVNQPIGWVIDGIFQEIDIQTGEVLFEWRSLDHVGLNETYNLLGSNADAGTGNTTALAWDYFHINSIEKDSEGNYIISSRYCSTVFKISGRTGSIIWRLGGKSSDFTFVDFPAPFAFQHDPRILSQEGPVTVISLFDNSSDGYNTTTFSSSGMIISLDTSTMTATLLNQYTNPPITTTLSTSQGSMQVLSNTNVFIGWGSVPQVSEFTQNGDCVALGAFGVVNEASSYRARKISTETWIGQPDSTPAIFTYANTTSLPTTFYVSWNGATQVASWRFYGGNSTIPAGLAPVGSSPRTGFETTFTASAFYAYGYAEALDANGWPLGKSLVVPTYVPFSAPSNGTVSLNGTSWNSTAVANSTVLGNGTSEGNSTSTSTRRKRRGYFWA